MSEKITKAIIPAAGLGTRFLPATKAMPKEMLTIVDKPVIQYVVEELVASGIEDIIIVTGSAKRPIEDHFDRSFDLEDFLEKVGKGDKAEEIRKIATMANFVYVRQKGPIGNATPVINAKHLVRNEPFIVIWGDEFIYSQKPRVKQLIETYEKYNASVISGVRIEDRENLSKYGIAKLKPVEGNVFQIEEIIEKPKITSNMILNMLSKVASDISLCQNEIDFYPNYKFCYVWQRCEFYSICDGTNVNLHNYKKR